MKSIKMVALDLDGTTLNSRNEVTLRTQKALEAASEQGVYVVVSTGRSYNSLPENVKSIRGIDYAVTSNGSHINILGTGESIFDSYLSLEAVAEIERIVKKYDLYIEVFIDGQAYIDGDYYRQIEQFGCSFRNAEYVLWSRKPVEDIVALMTDNAERIENVNFFFENVEELEDYRAEIEAIPLSKVCSSFKNNLEIGGPETSKKNALAELMNRLGVTSEELMCCGDAPNDIEMLDFAGLGVAMGNAWGGTKEHADYVTASNDEDGVALAIEKFVLK